MKYIFFAIIFVGLFNTCKKTASIPNIIEDPIDTTVHIADTLIIQLGKGYVLKNGIEWDAPFQAWYHTNTEKRFQVRAEILHPNFIEESFFIQDIPTQVGKYDIEFFPLLANLNNFTPESAFTMIHEFDQPVGDFLIDTTRTDHFVEVLKYDSINKIVEGRFQMFLAKRKLNNTYPGVPDSLFLTEGKFHLTIKKP